MPPETAQPAKPPPGAGVKPGEPYCSNCGYALTGATESAVCPECGRPLVEVLMRGRMVWSKTGRRYRSEAQLFGLPVIDIALGPHEDERIGRARGIIAIGDVATGWIALGGGWATGIVAIGGGGSIGIATIGGGVGIGVLALGGGCGAGGLAIGGGAVGGVALGGAALGIVAQGGGAIGIYARGGGATGAHTISPRGSDPAAVHVFRELAWLVPPPTSPLSMLVPVGVVGAAVVALGAAIGVIAMWALRRRGGGEGGGWTGAPRG